jgi:hypothetical protein
MFALLNNFLIMAWFSAARSIKQNFSITCFIDDTSVYILKKPALFQDKSLHWRCTLSKFENSNAFNSKTITDRPNFSINYIPCISFNTLFKLGVNLVTK